MKGQLSVGTAGSDKSEHWDAFVEHVEPGSLCHRYSWKGVLESTYGLQSEYLVAELGGEVVGILPLVVVSGLMGGKRLVSMPYLDQGGILATDGAIAEKLFQAAVRLADDLGTRGFDLRGGLVPEGPKADSPEPHRYRFLLQMPEDPDELWSSIGGKVRNQIRKSEKSNLCTTREDQSGLDDFYRIFSGNMKDLGSPVHSRRLFESILGSFGDQAGIYLTRDSNGQPVAGGVAIVSGDAVTVPWASSLRSARKQCPNHSLYWRILRDAVAHSKRVFDFGRSTQGTGTYNFKKQWNAEPMELSWSSFDIDGRPEAAKALDPRRNQGLARTWSHLPLGLANTLGPWVRKRLSN